MVPWGERKPVGEREPLLSAAINTACSDISSGATSLPKSAAQASEAKAEAAEARQGLETVDEAAVKRMLASSRPTPLRALVFVVLLACMAAAAIAFALVAHPGG